MANAYECDRCGKLYKMYHDKKMVNPWASNEVIAPNRICFAEHLSTERWIDYDLCPDCMAKAINFISNKEEPNGNNSKDN